MKLQYLLFHPNNSKIENLKVWECSGMTLKEAVLTLDASLLGHFRDAILNFN